MAMAVVVADDLNPHTKALLYGVGLFSAEVPGAIHQASFKQSHGTQTAADNPTKAGADPVQPWQQEPGRLEAGRAHQRCNQTYSAVTQDRSRK